MPPNRRGDLNTPLLFCCAGVVVVKRLRGRKKERRQMLTIVQFPHGGNEFPCNDDNCLDREKRMTKWNAGPHCRRLVKHRGMYVDKGGASALADLAFWTEWEANTVVNELPSLLQVDRTAARWVHTVVWPDPTYAQPKLTCRHLKQRRLGTQCSPAQVNAGTNTDPCVFGATFKYCLCRQKAASRILKHLDNGSLIVFGSTIEGVFYLDTVFVVNMRKEYETTPESIAKIKVSDEYKNLTLNRFIGFNGAFYRGATMSHKVNGMFSFTPAMLLHGDDHSFRRRCALNVAEINKLNGERMMFNPCSTQSIKSTEIDTQPGLVKDVWDEIRQQVLDQGFVLGTRFAWPKK